MRTEYLDEMITAECLSQKDDRESAQGTEVLCYIQRWTVCFHLNQMKNIFPIFFCLKEKMIIIFFLILHSACTQILLHLAC